MESNKPYEDHLTGACPQNPFFIKTGVVSGLFLYNYLPATFPQMKTEKNPTFNSPATGDRWNKGL